MHLFILGPADGNWMYVEDNIDRVFIHEESTILSPIVSFDGVPEYTPYKTYIYQRQHFYSYNIFAPLGTSNNLVIEALINSYPRKKPV